MFMQKRLAAMFQILIQNLARSFFSDVRLFFKFTFNPKPFQTKKKKSALIWAILELLNSE